MKFTQFLNEMPLKINTPDWSYDNAETKKYYYDEYSNGNFKLLDSFGDYRLIQVEKKLGKWYILLDDSTGMISFISKVKKGIKINGIQYYNQEEIWKENYSDLKGKAIEIFFKFILKDYNISSDFYQSEDGIKFWKSLVKYAIDNGYECGTLECRLLDNHKFKNMKDYEEKFDFIYSEDEGHDQLLYIKSK